MCSTADPLHIVKIVIGLVICFVLLLLVAVAGFVMFKKKYAIFGFCSMLFFLVLLNILSVPLLNAFLFFLLAKLKVQVVPSTPHQTQSISVLTMVGNLKVNLYGIMAHYSNFLLHWVSYGSLCLHYWCRKA